MAWYGDLTPCNYFGEEYAGQLRAIGWLERGHPFSQGQTPVGLMERLVEMLIDPWQPDVFRGFHTCSLCWFSRQDGVSWRQANQSIPPLKLGVHNLFIPGDGCLFAAPSLILHYIKAHHYAPGPKYVNAGFQCPPMRSQEYFLSVLKNGPPGFMKDAYRAQEPPSDLTESEN